MSGYDPKRIEPKWQGYWEENKTFRAEDGGAKPKMYILDMFPYPSGSGLHVGHPEGYTASDIVSRFKRMRGFNVLHPMGWDAFGLPAEQHALRTGTHPRDTTEQNIGVFRKQIKRLGFSYDWDREINTTAQNYYKWTQWIFLKLYERGLAYIAEVPVNWCPQLGTVLANEEVIDGKSEVGGFPVVKKPMRQWMLKITAYAERLLADLEGLDWSPSIKEMQRNWIGKRVGAEVDFALDGVNGNLRVFTTRPDTLFGATFMVMAPEHHLVEALTSDAQRAEVTAYQDAAARKSDLERTDLAKDKSGVFTGGYAINPVNDEKIPIWISDYVLASYGTGAIMAVPGHDERDWEFARKFDLPIIEVVAGGNIDEAAYTDSEDGVLVNSGILDGLKVPEAKKTITSWLEERGRGVEAVNYKLRDWLFSRQRYWGEPIPVVHQRDGSHKALSEELLPLVLPRTDNFKPSGSGESPLANITDWVELPDGERRETNTMPQWAGSCWYYLRFIDPSNDTEAWAPDKERYWMPVDLYIGGAEHAVLHLLYARFWHKVLYDCGLVSTVEPFQKLVNQGMILGYAYRFFTSDDGGEIHGLDQVDMVDGKAKHPDTGVTLLPRYVHVDEVRWIDEVPTHPERDDIRLEEIIEKMSKSRGNVVNPDDVINEYGTDALRLYEMYMGPLEQVKPWRTQGVGGMFRFLKRLHRLVIEDETGALQSRIVDQAPSKAVEKLVHKTIAKVTDDIEGLRFNTAIATLIELNNTLYKEKVVPRSVVERLALLVSPFAPHLGEELWQALGHDQTLAYEPWPTADPAMLIEDTIKLPVQVNGKVRASITVPADMGKDEILAFARAEENVVTFIEGKTLVKEIYVPRRIVNLVAK